LGENYRRIPSTFIRAKTKFAEELVQYGPVAKRSDYYSWLGKGTLVVSTANQENFGIAVVEAVRFGCLPLLPNRLVYPELVPRSLHPVSIYCSPKDLVRKLTEYLNHPHRTSEARRVLAVHMARFAWERRILAFDRCLDSLAAG
jgi:hypothetical protein